MWKMQRLKTLCRGWGLAGNEAIPVTIEHTVWYRKYQRRTLTGIGWKKKTVRSRTGKTPRTIVLTLCASTSASIMVRFFCILIGYAFNSMNLSPQRKTLFYNIGGFLCKILANSPINCSTSWCFNGFGALQPYSLTNNCLQAWPSGNQDT